MTDDPRKRRGAVDAETLDSQPAQDRRPHADETGTLDSFPEPPARSAGSVHTNQHR